jgi:hypothetical protein
VPTHTGGDAAEAPKAPMVAALTQASAARFGRT